MVKRKKNFGLLCLSFVLIISMVACDFRTQTITSDPIEITTNTIGLEELINN